MHRKKLYAAALCQVCTPLLDFSNACSAPLFPADDRYQTMPCDLGTPCLIHQPSYSMFNRWIEDGLLGVLEEAGVGCIVFSLLAQGLLTDRYLGEIPADSRMAKPHGFLQRDQLRENVNALDRLAFSEEELRAIEDVLAA